MALHGNMMLAPAGGYSGYQIDQSMVLDGSTDYLSRTPAGAGNRKTWSFSCWVKRSGLGAAQTIFSGGTSTTVQYFGFNASDKFEVFISNSTAMLVSTKVFRDVGSNYHVFVVQDTTESGSASDRFRVWINGLEITVWDTDSRSTYMGLNDDEYINQAQLHMIGRYSPVGVNYFNGYLSEMHFIDGTAHAPTDFGEFYNGTTAWRPIQPSGLTYGTNGFYLPFTQDTPNLGVDYSGNGNDWSENGSPVQSGDSPTKNFATWSPLRTQASGLTFTKGNRHVQRTSTSTYHSTTATFPAPATGKWYWEVNSYDLTAAGNRFPDGNGAGVAFANDDQEADSTTSETYWRNEANSYQFHVAGSVYRIRGEAGSFDVTTAEVPDLAASGADRFCFAWDADNGDLYMGYYDQSAGSTVWIANDAGLDGDPAAGTNETKSGLSGECWPVCTSWHGAVNEIFCDPDSFVGTIPAGYSELSAANLPEATITDPGEYFNAVTYTGDGTAIGSGGNSITGVGFQSDFTWIKNRDATDSHMLFDVIRGATKVLHSNETAAETTESETLTSFDSDGFTLGSDVEVNTNTEDYISWNWKAGGAGVPNTDGTTTATVSANDDAGFSIATWTSPLSATTIGHGLSAAPELIIAREYDGVMSWRVYHKDVGNGHYLLLDTSGAKSATSDWNSTDPTSSVFSVSNRFNTAGNYLAYCFRSIPGYSKVFSYTGNGSTDGTFVYLGFRPRFVMIKESSSTGSWVMLDTERSENNPSNSETLWANLISAEGGASSYLDILSNGFKIRDTDSDKNTSSQTYIGIAFAENPFGGSNLPLGLAR